MADTYRFPLLTASVLGPAEPELLDLAVNQPGFDQGGGVLFHSLVAWKQANLLTESPFGCAVIEFTSDMALTIGDGQTQLVGLFAKIDDPTGGATLPQVYCLGSLGIIMGGKLPQIPLVPSGVALAGFAQQISLVSVYDSIGIGMITADLNFGGPAVTVRARPIHRRAYPG